MDHINSTAPVIWLATSVRLATPILFAALGGLLCQKAGIFNFALEGTMLAGAYFGFFGALSSGNPWVGLLYAIAVGAAFGLLLGFISIHLGVSQLLAGIGLGILASGLTSYLYRLFDVGGRISAAPTLSDIQIPILSTLPVVGPILFQHSIFVYAGFALVILMAFFLYKTSFGLALRSVGENPQVSDAAGINVYRYRYFATIAGSILAALGGAFLTTTQVSHFVEDMSAGRGWIAIAAVFLGKYNPWGVLAACVLFGAADAAQMQAQILGVAIPYQFLLMMPYVMAILAVAGVVGKVRYPAAQGKPYLK
jgi:ABC-type uncharacterized transport system permease subunit